jgi:hypothetical protein
MPDGWNDDEELLAALRDALAARSVVPQDFVAAGKAAYTWHGVDAELARLTYDSTRGALVQEAVRAEAASLRTLTFRSAHLTVELEVTEESLLGQIVPVQAGHVEVQLQAGAGPAVSIDATGWFTVRPIPAGLFRLHIQPATGPAVLTGWLTL